MSDPSDAPEYSSTPPETNSATKAQQDVAGLPIQELLQVLGLHAPVDRGTIMGRVQRRLDAIPVSNTEDRELLRAIQNRLLEYMSLHQLGHILLNEDKEDYTAIQDTTGQVSQNPTRFYGVPTYPQQIVAGRLNPIDRRVMTRTLMVDSSFRRQFVAGDGILVCCGIRCAESADDCCSCAFPSNSVATNWQASTASNCIPNGNMVLQEGQMVNSAGPSTDWNLWHGEPNQRYIEAFRNQYLNCLPNAGEGVVLPCQMYSEPASQFTFNLQRSTAKVLSMTLTSINLPATSVLTVPSPDPSEYLAGPGLHNLQCVYPTPEYLSSISRLDPRSTIWIVDETQEAGADSRYRVYSLSIPAGHYPDSFAIAQAITTAWDRLVSTANPSTPLANLAGAFRADGVRAAYVYDPVNQDVPHAISPAHTSGHVSLSVPTEYIASGETNPWQFSIWFVPPPMTADGYLDVQARGTAVDHCVAHNLYDSKVCPPANLDSISDAGQPWVTNADTGETEFRLDSFRGVAATGGKPAIPPVIRGRQPPVFKALPGSLGWVLGFRVAQLSVADFAAAPQPLESFYPTTPAYPTPGVARSLLIGSSPFESSPPYLFLRVNDHNNNYYAAVEGIAEESVMPPDTLAILQLVRNPNLGISPNGTTSTNPPLEPVNTGYYSLSPHVPYKREYFGPVDMARIEVVLLDSSQNVCDLGQNNYSFTLTFETLYNL